MTVTDVTARIGQIQAQLAALDEPKFPGSPDYQAIFEQITKAGDSAITRPLGENQKSTTDTGSTEQTGNTGGGLSGADVVAEAKKYLGVPYVWGGEDPSGMDCSGFIQYVYDKLGVDLPRVSYEQATSGEPVDGLSNAQPGDILAFNSPVSHVGIYLGDNMMIHAPKPGEQVRIEEVYDTPTAIRRVIPEASSATAAGSIPGEIPYENLFEQAGSQYGVDPALLAAIAKQESGYDPKAVSSAGAQGLMQLMPATAEGLGVSNSFDPQQAVDGAARLMKSLLGEFGRTDLALAAYNAGPGAVHRYDGIPPYPETQNYVTSIRSILDGYGGSF